MDEEKKDGTIEPQKKKRYTRTQRTERDTKRPMVFVLLSVFKSFGSGSSSSSINIIESFLFFSSSWWCPFQLVSVLSTLCTVVVVVVVRISFPFSPRASKRQENNKNNTKGGCLSFPSCFSSPLLLLLLLWIWLLPEHFFWLNQLAAFLLEWILFRSIFHPFSLLRLYSNPILLFILFFFTTVRSSAKRQCRSNNIPVVK